MRQKRKQATFPFYMNHRQKQWFLNEVYGNLIEKPDYNQFLWDVKLAVLNEYVEFMEADEDESKWYDHHARLRAQEILKSRPGNRNNR